MDILYQDNRIAVCLKPPGVLSTDEPGGMPSLLRAALGTDCVRTVHRLDAAVGGVMVFARSRMAASILSEQIREHRFQKEYLAVVHGMLPAEGRMQDFLLRDRRDGMTRVADAFENPNKLGRVLGDYVDALRDCATVGHFPLIEMGQSVNIHLSNEGQCLEDHVHPNEEGYRRIANVLIREIQAYWELVK